MESILFRLLNYKEYNRLEDEIELLSDEDEREVRSKLLERIHEAVLDYDLHLREYAWKQSIGQLLERGVSIEAASRHEVVGQWDACFDSLVSEDVKKATAHYSNQFRWHLFSFELLNALQGDEARAAFDRKGKGELYLFFDYADECRLVKNAGLLTAADVDAVKENSPLNYMDMYLFDSIGKWTYVKPHEEYCGPYFFAAE